MSTYLERRTGSAPLCPPLATAGPPWSSTDTHVAVSTPVLYCANGSGPMAGRQGQAPRAVSTKRKGAVSNGKDAMVRLLRVHLHVENGFASKTHCRDNDAEYAIFSKSSPSAAKCSCTPQATRRPRKSTSKSEVYFHVGKCEQIHTIRRLTQGRVSTVEPSKALNTEELHFLALLWQHRTF